MICYSKYKNPALLYRLMGIGCYFLVSKLLFYNHDNTREKINIGVTKI